MVAPAENGGEPCPDLSETMPCYINPTWKDRVLFDVSGVAVGEPVRACVFLAAIQRAHRMYVCMFLCLLPGRFQDPTRLLVVVRVSNTMPIDIYLAGVSMVVYFNPQVLVGDEWVAASLDDFTIECWWFYIPDQTGRAARHVSIPFLFPFFFRSCLFMFPPSLVACAPPSRAQETYAPR